MQRLTSSVPDPGSEQLTLWEGLALALPWLFALLVILRLSVPTLLMDEWGTFGAWLLEVKQHGLSFELLFRPHNEHRIVVSRLLFYLLSSQSLNPLPLMLLSHVVLGVAYLQLLPLVRGACQPLLLRGRVLLYVALSALCFSGVQYENLLWGLQVGWSCVLLGIVLSVRGIVVRSAWRIVLGGALAYVSYAHWLVIAALLLVWQAGLWLRSSKQPDSMLRALRLLGVTMGALLLWRLYIHNVPRPASHPSLLFPLLHPLTGLHYLLLYLGNVFYLPPWPQLGSLCSVLGGSCFAIASVWTLWTGRTDPSPFESLVRWTLFAVWAVALLIVMGRSGLGPQSATWSRYTTFMLLGWLTLLCALLRRSHHQLVKGKPLVQLCCLGVCAVVTLLGLGYLGTQLTRAVPARRAAAVCLAEVIQDPSQLPHKQSCLIPLYPDPVWLQQVATKLGWQLR